MERISSAQNPTLKLARKLLKSTRERNRTGKILLDGPHLVRGYSQQFGLSGAVLLVEEGATRSPEIRDLVGSIPDDARIFEISPRDFAGIAPVDTPAGIIALCDRPEVPAVDQPAFVLMLDGIQNPGNLGSILRTAAASGVDEVVLSSQCADPWSPKCLRGGMGAQFVLPARIDIDVEQFAARFEGKRVATSSHVGQPLTSANLTGRVLIMFGGEGAGLNGGLMGCADVAVRIPLKHGMESLNVGAAVAMFCYEHLRQSAD